MEALELFAVAPILFLIKHVNIKCCTRDTASEHAHAYVYNVAESGAGGFVSKARKCNLGMFGGDDTKGQSPK
jgi:hypothetical protein